MTVYSCCVTPSSAVTRTTTAFAPAMSASGALAVPFGTATNVPPLTCTATVAPVVEAVGVTVSVVVAYGTAEA